MRRHLHPDRAVRARATSALWPVRKRWGRVDTTLEFEVYAIAAAPPPRSYVRAIKDFQWRQTTMPPRFKPLPTVTEEDVVICTPPPSPEAEPYSQPLSSPEPEAWLGVSHGSPRKMTLMEFRRKLDGLLDAVREWMVSSTPTFANKYFEAGDSTLETNAYLGMQRTVLPHGAFGIPEAPSWSSSSVARGVHVQCIGVPAAFRRQGYATLMLADVERLAQLAGLAYVVVESVMTPEMHAVMLNTDFAPMPFSGNNNYILVIAETTGLSALLSCGSPQSPSIVA